MSDPDGLEIVRRLIAEVAESKTSSLDLSLTGITDLSPLGNLQNLTSIACSHISVSDLSPLANLQNLTSIDCSVTQVSDLSPLANLQNLTSIDCGVTQVSDLSPLANLQNLTSIACFGTRVSDLSPLANLQNLTSIDCSHTSVSDLSPLAKLQNLTSIACSSTQVSDLSPLGNLQNLTSINCNKTSVSDLSPLANLQNLTSIACFGTQVSDLSPLGNLQSLTSINCRFTSVSDLSPLANLQSLTSIDCSSSPVSDLSPLGNLQNLTSIDCTDTSVNDLSPLVACKKLARVAANNRRLDDFPRSLLDCSRLEELFLHETQVRGIPTGVLSTDPGSCCLESLRAHFADLIGGGEPDQDVKVIVIGNGRIGKTQICRRLHQWNYDETVDSTHGITVSHAPLRMSKDGNDVTLNLWDFGGQDLYHGTHSLFMKTRAIFLVIWTPLAEKTNEYTHNGIRFRNQRLPYWLSYVRNLAGKMSPVVIVQNQCDTALDEESEIPANLSEFQFPYVQKVHYSAKEDRKRASLDDALQSAVEFLRESEGVASIGKGRMKVRKQLLQWQDEDSRRIESKRRHRTVSQDEFRELCRKAGGVSSPESLLEYLHNCGVVFYRRGVFDDQIVLDQSWALDAVYAVFHREKCYRQLQSLGGRFTRSLLDTLVWQKYTAAEQELFLSMMTSCGICFVHRQAEGDIEAEYVAPDLLPDRDAVSGQLAGRWNQDAETVSLTWTFDFLHPGLVRTVISKLGNMAGDSAVYWKYGLWAYEGTARASFQFEQKMLDECRGQLILQAQGNLPQQLLTRLAEWVEECHAEFGCGKFETSGTAMDVDRREGSRTRVESRGDDDRSANGLPLLQLQDPPRPPSERRVCISYAWKDERSQEPDRTAKVETFCNVLAEAGITVIRDTKNVNIGDRLSNFMRTIAAGDVVFVFLSDAYLRSPNCMYELSRIWNASQDDPDRFLKQIRVFPMPGTKIHTIPDRLKYSAFWIGQRDEIKSIVGSSGLEVLGAVDLAQYKQIQEFAHRVSDILGQISDVLLEGDFDEFIAAAIKELNTGR